MPGIKSIDQHRGDVPKDKIAISIDPSLLKWIDGQVQARRFASRSHAFEYAINELKKRG